MTSLTKNLHPHPKSFIQVQSTRLAVFFETLTRSVALTGLEKFLHKAMWVSVFFIQKSPKAAGHQSVNTNALSCSSRCAKCLCSNQMTDSKQIPACAVVIVLVTYICMEFGVVHFFIVTFD